MDGMSRPFVIAVNSISGGGKTSLANVMHDCLPNSTLFRFDDFDATNLYPTDFHDWYRRGGNLEEFDCLGMKAAVDAEIQKAEVKYIVLDYPFGRDHSRFRDVIDLSIYIDTPLDVALARRIMRDFVPRAEIAPQVQFRRLRDELSYYLAKGRPIYLDNRHIHTCDLKLDGLKPLDELRDQVLEAVGIRI